MRYLLIVVVFFNIIIHEAKAVNLCTFFWTKIKEGSEMSFGIENLYAFELRALIMMKTKKIGIVPVPLEKLSAIHQITSSITKQKISTRAKSLLAEKSSILSKGTLTQSDLERLVPSKNNIRVLSAPSGLIIFDGNGRFYAIDDAFHDSPKLLVDIELYETNSAYIDNLVKKIKELRGLDDL